MLIKVDVLFGNMIFDGFVFVGNYFNLYVYCFLIFIRIVLIFCINKECNEIIWEMGLIFFYKFFFCKLSGFLWFIFRIFIIDRWQIDGRLLLFYMKWGQGYLCLVFLWCGISGFEF